MRTRIDETATVAVEKIDTVEGRRRTAEPGRQRSVDSGAAINFSEIDYAVCGDHRIGIDGCATRDVVRIVRDRGWRPELWADASRRSHDCRSRLVSLIDGI